jgi:hypothetical protein
MLTFWFKIVTPRVFITELNIAPGSFNSLSYVERISFDFQLNWKLIRFRKRECLEERRFRLFIIIWNGRLIARARHWRRVAARGWVWGQATICIRAAINT